MVDVERVEVLPDGDVLLDTGSPHLVRFVENLDLNFCGVGRELRYGEKTAATGGANINFVKIEGEGRVAIRTYERGVEDFTLACGTGAASTAAVLTLKGLLSGEDVHVRSAGGVLTVDMDRVGSHIDNLYLTGPTNFVAEGEITDEDLPL